MGMIRLDKFLADMSFGTRKEVKKIIKDKRVVINGNVVKNSELKIDESTVVYVDGQEVIYKRYEYYLLNKPKGYICATEDGYSHTVMELIESERHDLFPVGRLDKDTTGVLLICNDGQLAHQLLSPDSHVEKKYHFTCIPNLPRNAEEILAKPIEFPDFTTEGGTLVEIEPDTAFLTIHEGKYHQVKRMIGYLGCQVTSLHRVSFGTLTLGNLMPGQYRRLKDSEVEQLRELVQKK